MKVKPSQKPGGIVGELNPQDEKLLEKSTVAATPFKLKKVLVPVDFSECSKKALQYAIPFAKKFNASLTLLYVVQLDYSYGEFGAVDYAGMEKDLQQSGAKRLAELAGEEIGGIIQSQTVVKTGRPATEIAEAAKKLAIDLIIMSTHGHTGLKHVFLGSTTENVVRYAPCPVLTVREHEHEFVNPLPNPLT